MHGALDWTLVASGYVLVGVVFGLALRPAATLMKRWGRAAAEKA
jgi:hypothetical protein